MVVVLEAIILQLDTNWSKLNFPQARKWTFAFLRCKKPTHSMDTSVRYILLFLPFIFFRNVFTFQLILVWLIFLSYFFRFGDGCSKKPQSFLYQFSVNWRRKSSYRITLQNTCLGHIWQIHRGVLHWKNRKFLCVSWFHGSDAVADWVGITRKSFLLQ